MPTKAGWFPLACLPISGAPGACATPGASGDRVWPAGSRGWLVVSWSNCTRHACRSIGLRRPVLGRPLPAGLGGLACVMGWGRLRRWLPAEPPGRRGLPAGGPSLICSAGSLPGLRAGLPVSGGHSRPGCRAWLAAMASGGTSRPALGLAGNEANAPAAYVCASFAPTLAGAHITAALPISRHFPHIRPAHCWRAGFACVSIGLRAGRSSA